MPLKTRSHIATILLITAMFALVDISAEKEIIFPEISALALGFWMMGNPPWRGNRLAVWASPTLAALTGVLLVRYMPLPPFVLIGCAFVLVVLQLKLLRSEVFPSISAAILAIITHTTNWLYPLSVGVLMAIIILGRHYLGHSLLEHASIKNAAPPAKGSATNTDRVYWCKIFSCALATAALALGTDNLFMIAPPLIVAFIELSRPDQTLRRTPVRAILLLFLAAGTGVLCFSLIVTILHGPLWLFGGLTLTTVFFLFHVFETSFPPVAAIALLPVLVPASCFWTYPLHVLAGSTLFVSMGIYFFRINPDTQISPSRGDLDAGNFRPTEKDYGRTA